MKTIEQCIEDNKAFVVSLKELLVEATDKGEDAQQIVFVFLKPNESVVGKIITGNNIALFGCHEDMISSHGFNIGELLELCESKLAQ